MNVSPACYNFENEARILYACMHASKHACTHACTHARTHARTHTPVRTLTHSHSCMMHANSVSTFPSQIEVQETLCSPFVHPIRDGPGIQNLFSSEGTTWRNVYASFDIHRLDYNRARTTFCRSIWFVYVIVPLGELVFQIHIFFGIYVL